MMLDALKSSTDWFGVRDFKAIEDPSHKVDRKEILVPLDQYPEDFSLGPNPREPKVSSKVSRDIGDTLREYPEHFHLLNRGITIVAKTVQYDNQSKRVRLRLHESEEEERYFGILDGGNTNERIKIWRRALDQDDAKEILAQTYVNVQVLIPKGNDQEVPTSAMQDLLNDIKEARNTSVQVKEKSLADARRHFDQLKSVLESEPYFGNIVWHEGPAGLIDVLDIVTLIVIYYPKYSEESEADEPHGAYGHKERCLKAYLDYAENNPERLSRWISVTPTLVHLFDHIQCDLPERYVGHFGRIGEVKIYDEAKYQEGNRKKYSRTSFRSKYLERDMKYRYPQGYVFPLFAAFRGLAKEDGTGRVVWKRQPIEFWQRHMDRIVRQYKQHMEANLFTAKRIATNPTCYQAMRQAVNDAYKDELLEEAGIES